MEQYNHKILIIEDEEIMLSTISDNLTMAGFTNILKARNGVDGLNMALKENPDLILLDIVMPLMDGMDMIKRLRENPKGKNIKVIFLTNLTADESIMDGIIKNNPSYYVIKTDYSVDDIINKVKTTLNIKPLLS
jgi:DNA-binding response OmpR family regulator